MRRASQDTQRDQSQGRATLRSAAGGAHCISKVIHKMRRQESREEETIVHDVRSLFARHWAFGRATHVSREARKKTQGAGPPSCGAVRLAPQ